MTFYSKHLFFCTNQRSEGKKCCANNNSTYYYKYAKEKIRSYDKGRVIKVSQSGCLGQCIRGPVLAIYPDAIWYTYRTEKDIDEIIDSHLFQSIVVQHLLLSRDEI